MNPESFALGFLVGLLYAVFAAVVTSTPNG